MMRALGFGATPVAGRSRRRRGQVAVCLGLLVAGLGGCAARPATAAPIPSVQGTRPWAAPDGPGGQTTVAFISDFGQCDDGQRQIADLVRSWDPALVFSAGDNSQGVDGCDPFTESVGAYYGDYLQGARGPRLFPALGNHDYEDVGAGLAAYRSFFSYLDTTADPLGRWYVKSVGNINVYVLDSNAPAEETPAQQRFLQGALSQRAPGTWNLVVFHHPPFTSGPHPAQESWRPSAGWLFKEWGADLVIAGHQHVLEDLLVDGMPYLVAGVGGHTLERDCPATRAEGSRVCVKGIGALRVAATDARLLVDYIQPESQATPAHRLELARP